MANSINHNLLVTLVLLCILETAIAGCTWDATECPGHNRVCQYNWWTKAIMLAIVAAIVAGAAATGVVTAIVAKVLGEP